MVSYSTPKIYIILVVFGFMAEHVLGAPADDDHAAETAYITKDAYIDSRAGCEDKNHGGCGNFQVQETLTGKIRALIEITIPPNPYPLSGLLLKKLILRVYCYHTAGTLPIYAYLLNHSEWGEGDKCEEAAGDDECSWNCYSSPSTWQEAGASDDYNKTTDFGIGNGIIARFLANTKDVWYDMDLTPLIEKGDITWDSRFSILLIGQEGGGTKAQFASRTHATVNDRLYLKIYFEDPMLQVPIIETSWDKINQKVKFNVEVPDDLDWKRLFLKRTKKSGYITDLDGDGVTATVTSANHGLRVDDVIVIINSHADYNGSHTILSVPDANTFTFATTSSIENFMGDWIYSGDVDYARGIVRKVDYDALENQEYITNQRAKNIIANHTDLGEPEENEYYGFAGFSEDNNNIVANSVKSNEISIIRPRVRFGHTDDRFTILAKDGHYGANIDVKEKVFINVLARPDKVSIETMKEVYIDWGDGGSATYDWIFKTPTTNPGTGTTIIVSNTVGLKVGDYIVISEDILGWKYNIKQIIALSATVITLDSALSSSYTTAANVVKTRSHRYSTTGEKSALLQLTNMQGFQSKLREVSTKPDPQPLQPIAIINSQRLSVSVDKEFVLSGIKSKCLNMDRYIKWNNGTGAGKSYWWMSSGTGTATFSDNDSPQTTCKFSESGVKVISLQVADDAALTDTATITINVVGEDFINFDSNIIVINYAAASGDKVTINGTDIVEGVDFNAVTSNLQTATNLAAAINTKNISHVHAVSGGAVVSLVGIISSLTTDDATAFTVKIVTTKFDTRIKIPGLEIDIKSKLGTTGFIKRLLSKGSDVFNIAGKIFKVIDRKNIEKLNTEDYYFALMVINDSMRILYVSKGGVKIIEDSKKTIPADESDDEAIGTWGFSGAFIDGGEYSG